MLKTIKIIAITILAAIFILLTTAFVLIKSFDPNIFKAAAEEFILDKTGRKFTINGDISIEFRPFLLVHISDISLSNAAGFERENMAEIEQLSVGLRLFPLIKRKIEINGVNIDGMTLYHTIAEDGTTNIDDIVNLFDGQEEGGLTTPLQRDRSAQRNRRGLELDIDDTSIRAFTLHNVTLVKEDLRNNSSVTVDNLSMDSSLIAMGLPVSMNLSAQVNGVNPDFTAHASMTGTFIYSFTRLYLRGADLLVEYDIPAQEATGTARLAAKGEYAISTGMLELEEIVLTGTTNNLDIGKGRYSGTTEMFMSGVMDVNRLKITAEAQRVRIDSNYNLNNNDHLHITSDVTLNVDLALLDGIYKLNSSHDSTLSADIHSRNESYSADMGLSYMAEYKKDNATLGVILNSLRIDNISTRSDNLTTEGILTANAQLLYDIAGESLGVKNAHINVQNTGRTSGGLPTMASLSAVFDGSYSFGRAMARMDSLSLLLDSSAGDATLNVNLKTTVANDFDTKRLNLNGATITTALMLPLHDNATLKANFDGNINGDYTFSSGTADIQNSSGTVTASIGSSSASAKMTTNTVIRHRDGYYNIDNFTIDGTISNPNIPAETQNLHAEGSFIFDRDNISVSAFRLSALGLDAAISGTASGLKSNPAVQARITTGRFSPRDVMAYLGHKEIADRFNTAVLRNATINGTVFYENKILNLPLNFILDNTTATMNSALNLSGPKPAVDIILNMNRLNIMDYIPTFPVKAEPKEKIHTTYDPYGAPTIVIPEVDLTPYPNVNLNITAGRVDITGGSFQDVAISASLEDGLAKIPNVSGRMNSGEFAFSATREATPQRSAMTLNGSIKDIALQPIANLFNFNNILFPGTTTMEIDAGYEERILTVNQFTLTNGDLSANMTLDANLRRQPMITFNLAATNVNLDNYINRNRGSGTGAGGGNVKTYLISDFPGTVSGRFTMDSLNYRKFAAEKISGDLRIEQGQGRVRSNFNAYGGTMDGNITAEGEWRSPDLTAVYNINGIKMDNFIRHIKNTDRPIISGTLSAHATMTTKGLRYRDVVQNLDGNARYYLRDATLHGIGYDPNLLSMDNVRTFILLSEERRTAINNLNGDFTVEKGILHLPPVTIMSSNMTLNLSGDMDLYGRAFDFNGSVSLGGTTEAQLTIGGTADKPDVYIDQSALRSGLVIQMTNRTGRNLITAPISILEGITNTVEKGLDSFLPPELQ